MALQPEAAQRGGMGNGEPCAALPSLLGTFAWHRKLSLLRTSLDLLLFYS